MNDELRAITRNQRSFDSAVMMSSLMPSEKYSCSGSPLMLTKGKHGNRRPIGQRQSGGAAGAAGAVPAASPQGADKAEAFARDGADQALLLAAVADRLARGIDAAGQRRIRDDAAPPDRGDQVVLADDAVAILDQVDQQIEHLRLERDQLAAAPQFAPILIEGITLKEIANFSPLAQPRGGAGRRLKQ